MNKVYPDNPDTWHLYHIFARTIRHDPSNRWQSAEDAISVCNHLRRVILGGYPAVEEFFDHCPVCGVGSLEDFSGSHMVFGNPNPAGISGKQCSYCGICLAINYEHLRNQIKKMESME